MALAAAITLGAAITAGVALVERGGRPPPDQAPAVRGQPGRLGQTMAVGRLRVTVLSVVLGAEVPVSADPDAADRLVVVQVRCEAPAGAAPVSPYDRVVTDASGEACGAIVDGLPGDPLPELRLAPAERVRGRDRLPGPEVRSGARPPRRRAGGRRLGGGPARLSARCSGRQCARPR